MKQNSIDKKYRELNDFIRGELKRQKISQDKAAHWLNISRASFSYRMCGKIEWTVREILSLFELLEIGEETWQLEIGSTSDR